jgi:hypothetical protein
MAKKGLPLRRPQPYCHFYPRVRQTSSEAVKSQHQMTRAMIWAPAYPSRGQACFIQDSSPSMLKRSRFLARTLHTLLQPTAPVQERSNIHAEGVLFAAVQQNSCEWPSPANLILSLNLNLWISILRFSSRSFPDLLQRSILCSKQPRGPAVGVQFVALHVILVLILFRSQYLNC